jgi:hypothetical protein
VGIELINDVVEQIARQGRIRGVIPWQRRVRFTTLQMKASSHFLSHAIARLPSIVPRALKQICQSCPFRISLEVLRLLGKLVHFKFLRSDQVKNYETNN